MDPYKTLMNRGKEILHSLYQLENPNALASLLFVQGEYLSTELFEKILKDMNIESLKEFSKEDIYIWNTQEGTVYHDGKLENYDSNKKKFKF